MRVMSGTERPRPPGELADDVDAEEDVDAEPDFPVEIRARHLRRRDRRFSTRFSGHSPCRTNIIIIIYFETVALLP